MPVKNRDRYPDNWEEISRYIRFERAGGCCEWCGAPHGTEIGRRYSDPAWIPWDEIAPEHRYEFRKMRVVLTTAHLDHDESNNDPENLAALCQRCHFNHDREDNLKRKRRNRRRAQVDAGQLTLLEVP